MNKDEQKKHLIDIMKLDEESGLYNETEHLLSTQANRNRLLCKDCNKSLEDCTCIEDTIELPNQALIDAAERLKGKKLFKESNDRARKILSEIKSLPIQETLEEAAERFYQKGLKDDLGLSFHDGVSIGAKWQQEQIGKSEFLQRLRGTLSDAEARRLIFEQFKNK